MGNCRSTIPFSLITIDCNYILFENCNDKTKERIYTIMDQRIQEAKLKDHYNMGFSLKTFFLPGKVSDEHLYTYYDIYPNIETKEKDENESNIKDVYVNYSFILDRLKRYIDYSYTIHHLYWYSLQEVFDNQQKKCDIISEPFQYQIIDGKYYKWYGLLHISKINQPVIQTPTETIHLTINSE